MRNRQADVWLGVGTLHQVTDGLWWHMSHVKHHLLWCDRAAVRFATCQSLNSIQAEWHQDLHFFTLTHVPRSFLDAEHHSKPVKVLQQKLLSILTLNRRIHYNDIRIKPRFQVTSSFGARPAYFSSQCNSRDSTQ